MVLSFSTRRGTTAFCKTLSNTFAAHAAPQDILLELVYDEFALILAARRRQAEHDAELARFLAAVDTWASDRTREISTQHADRLTEAALLLEENQIWWERQQRPAVQASGLMQG